MGKEVRIYTSFSDASDGGCRVRSLVPLFISLCYIHTTIFIHDFFLEISNRLILKLIIITYKSIKCIELIKIYFKTTQITIKFHEQCILPRIMPVSKSLFVVNINFVWHHTTGFNRVIFSFVQTVIAILSLWEDTSIMKVVASFVRIVRGFKPVWFAIHISSSVRDSFHLCLADN